MYQPANNKQSGFWMTVLLLITVGTTVFLISPVSAEKPVVTIVAHGDGSYYLGEKVIFSGMNTDSGSTYLYITGPNLPDGGGKLSSPSQNAVSGDAGSFNAATTKPDKTWEYPWYTSGLQLDAGTYTIYAVSQPKAKDQLAETPYGTTGIIIKKPFITGAIFPETVTRGLSFTVSGVAEGVPPDVQVWILGKNYYTTSIVPVNSDASFTYVVPQEVTSQLANGQYFVIVQHPMMNNQFDIDISGDYVKLNNDTNLFRITGPGSLQGSDAADALIAAISDQEAHDTTYTSDTYTLIPFQVADAGNPASQAPADAGNPLEYALHSLEEAFRSLF